MRLQMEMAEKLADGFSPHAAFEAKHKQSGHDQADEPVSACLGFPQRRLRIAVAAVHRLEVTMHTAFGKSGVLRKASDALLPVFTNRVENDQALGPQSHSGGPCSEGWLTWCLKSALQSTRSTTHCPALETWPREPRGKPKELPKPVNKLSGGPIEVVLTALWATLAEFKRAAERRGVFAHETLTSIEIESRLFKHDCDGESSNERSNKAIKYLGQLLGGVDRLVEKYL